MLKRMIKIFTTVFLCFIVSQNVFAKLYAKPIEWSIKGPGGRYGIYVWHSECSEILLGPVQFSSGFQFEMARLIYFEITPILIVGFVIAFLLSFKERKDRGKPVAFSQEHLLKYWDYYFLFFSMVLGIIICILSVE